MVRKVLIYFPFHILAHKKHPPRRTLKQEYTPGPMVIPGGVLFLLSEIPLYASGFRHHFLEESTNNLESFKVVS